QLDEAYRSFGGEGLTLTLRRLSGEPSPSAQAFALALRIEVANRRAKRSKNRSGAQLYQEKRRFIRDLIQLAKHEDAIALRKGQDPEFPHQEVLYAYLPSCEQISWHTPLHDERLPPEESGWDGKSCSTLAKLEQAILQEFPPNSCAADDCGNRHRIDL
ncbi:MAG: hypothetical protein AAF191_15970, partial [Verrucomicrobiota bacterium]